MKAFALATAVVLLPASSAILGAASPESKCRLHVGSAPLDEVLPEVGRQCSVQILYYSDVTAGQTAPPLSGEYSVDDALKRLLDGAGLAFRRVNATTFEIRPAYPVNRPAARAARGGPGNETELQEIVINGTVEGLVATRTETPLREVPQSISIISAEQMRQQNNVNLYEVAQDAVGISSARSDTYFSVLFTRGYILGGYTLDGGGGLRAVAHFPGLPIVLLTPDFAEFDHVEVLRGSNALFGADGTPAGAINLIRKRPLDEPIVRFSASAGSWKNYRQELDATGPLALDGALRGRMVVTNSSRNYFYETARDDRQSVYGVLDFDLTEGTLLSVGGSYLKSSGLPFEKGLLVFSDGTDPHLPRDTSYAFDWSRFDTRVAEGFLRLEQAIAGESRLRINATLIDNKVAYAVGYHSSQLSSITGLAARPSGQYTVEPYIQRQLNFEATLTGKLWNGRAEWVLGGDYLRARSASYTAQITPYGAPIDPYNFDAAAYAYPIKNVTPLPLATGDTIYTRIGGVFASLRVDLMDPWSVTAGLRRSTEHVTDDLVYYWSGKGYPAFTEFDYENVITPYVGTLFALNQTWSLYASYTDIFLNNANLLRSDRSRLPPSRGITMEGGIKGVWRDGALNASLALYRIAQRDVGLRDTTVPGSPGCCWTSGGKSESEGVELEVSGHLASRWLIGGGYTFNQNRLLTSGSLQSTPRSGFPRHILRLWTDYGLPASWGRWSVGGSLDAQGSSPVAGKITQKSFAVISPRVSYGFNERWRLALTIDNLFDTQYYEGGYWYGEPRNYLLRLDAWF